MDTDDDLDRLTEEITVDAYGDEGYSSFVQAFEEEVRFPIAATLAGSPVAVRGVGFDGNERRGIVATITRGGRKFAVSLVDLIPTTDATAAQLVAAYRRWIGMT